MAQRKPIDVHFAFRQYADQQLESIVIFEAERSLRRVLYVNDAFKELTGYLPRDVIGKSIFRFLGCRRGDPVTRRLLKALRERAAYTCTLQSTRKDGSQYWSDISLTPVIDEANQSCVMVALQRDVTSSVQGRHSLHTSYQILKSVLDRASDPILILDRHGIIKEANTAAAKVMKTPGHVLREAHITQFVPASFQRRLVWLAKRLGRRNVLNEAAVQLVDGSGRHMLTWWHLSRLDDGEILCVKNGSPAQIRRKKALVTSSPAAQALLDHSSDGFISAGNDGRILFINREARNICHIAEELPLKGLLVTEAVPDYLKSTIAELQVKAMRSRRQQRENHLSPNRRWLQLTIFPEADGFNLIIKDVTLSQEYEARLRELAQEDSLTGLPNRRVSEDTAQMLVDEARRTGGAVAALFLDLDKFKEVNDSFGHVVGDQLLKSISEKFRNAIRDAGFVGRLSGDEFLFLLPHAPIETARQFAEEILGMLREPFVLSGYEFHVGGSIGIAFYPDTARSAEELLVQADAAIYEAKKEGGFLVRDYNLALAERDHLKNRLRRDLRSAIGTDQFCFYYQPIYDASTRQLTGAEALLRWRHPSLGLLAPGDFLSLIDESALGHFLNEWSVQAITEQVAEWSRRNSTVPVSLNLSPRQLCDGKLPSLFSEALKMRGVDGRKIVIEVTEDALMTNVDMAARVISGLSLLGLSIAIDDFGTGYSTFGHLKTLPIDCVKIDKYFIQNSSFDAKSLLITEAIVSLAKSLSLVVVAEGIENSEQLEFAREIGCDSVQGFWLGAPMPAADFAALLCCRVA